MPATTIPQPPVEPPAADDASGGFWLHAMPGHRVRRLHQRIVAEFNALVSREAGLEALTHMQFAALAAIEYRPGADQATVARLIGCDKVTAGKLLERLVGRGWVDRLRDTADRRARRLALTAGGRAVLDRIRPLVRGGPLERLPPLTAAERSTLMDLLGRLTMPYDDA